MRLVGLYCLYVLLISIGVTAIVDVLLLIFADLIATTHNNIVELAIIKLFVLFVGIGIREAIKED